MNRKKHESSLLEALSDAGSTPAASTIFSPYFKCSAEWRFCRGFEKSGCFFDGFAWLFRGSFVVFLWFLKTHFSTLENMPTFQNIFLHSK
jgi:hypothetical protein